LTLEIGIILTIEIAKPIWAACIVIISPLLSLILNQIYNLKKCSIEALHLCGEQEINEKEKICAELKKHVPSYDMLYLTPEMLNQNAKISSEIKGFV